MANAGQDVGGDIGAQRHQRARDLGQSLLAVGHFAGGHLGARVQTDEAQVAQRFGPALGTLASGAGKVERHRTQPGLPMKKGPAGTMTHDYKRHRTTTLFAALNVATGAVIGRCFSRHRATEFRKFLDRIEAEVPSDLDVHIVMDNYATHKTPAVKAWLARRPHWHIHFTPTSASWINQVERWFAELTRKQIQRGVHTSVAQLEADIRSFIEQHNANPKPFRWTKSADEILAAVKRFCQKTERTLCGGF